MYIGMDVDMVYIETQIPASTNNFFTSVPTLL